jgi:hypothetical protein
MKPIRNIFYIIKTFFKHKFYPVFKIFTSINMQLYIKWSTCWLFFNIINIIKLKLKSFIINLSLYIRNQYVFFLKLTFNQKLFLILFLFFIIFFYIKLNLCFIFNAQDNNMVLNVVNDCDCSKYLNHGDKKFPLNCKFKYDNNHPLIFEISLLPCSCECSYCLEYNKFVYIFVFLLELYDIKKY